MHALKFRFVGWGLWRSVLWTSAPQSPLPTSAALEGFFFVAPHWLECQYNQNTEKENEKEKATEKEKEKENEKVKKKEKEEEKEKVREKEKQKERC